MFINIHKALAVLLLIFNLWNNENELFLSKTIIPFSKLKMLNCDIELTIRNALRLTKINCCSLKLLTHQTNLLISVIKDVPLVVRVTDLCLDMRDRILARRIGFVQPKIDYEFPIAFINS